MSAPEKTPYGERSREEETCPRCGSYAELRWHGRRRRLCAECIERVRHPLETAPATAGGVLSGVGQLLAATGPRLALAASLVQIPLALLILLTDLPATALSLYSFITLVGTGAVIELALRVVDGEPTTLIAAYRLALRKWLGMIAAEIFAGLIILVFILLLVVPGLVRALSYAIVLPLIIDGEAHGVDALEMSRKRMKGHRLQALLAYLVTFTPSILSYALYLALATALSGADVGALVVGEPLVDYPSSLRLLDALDMVLYPVFELPVVLTAVVLHAKLRSRDGD